MPVTLTQNSGVSDARLGRRASKRFAQNALGFRTYIAAPQVGPQTYLKDLITGVVSSRKANAGWIAAATKISRAVLTREQAGALIAAGSPMRGRQP